jgi:hypothetical protein
MDTSLRTSSAGALSRSESGSPLGRTNECGIEQQDGTASRLSSVSFMLNESEGTRNVKPLAYDGGDLRNAADTGKSWGRFKNWLADKLPFVGKTTYGTILQKADAFSARAKDLTGGQKAGALLSLKQSIESWQQKHPTATSSKADGIARLGQAVATALRDAKAEAVLNARYPAAFDRPGELSGTMESEGPITPTARQMFDTMMTDDPRPRTSNGRLDIVSDGGFPPVSSVFKADFVGRTSPMTLSDGVGVAFDRKNDKGVDARTALLNLTGDQAVATSLSQFIGQNMLAPLEGAKAKLLEGPNGEPNPIPDMGLQETAIDVRKNPPSRPGGEPTYTITYTALDPIPRLGMSRDDAVAYKPGSEVVLTYQIQLKESDLWAGNGVFAISQEPSYVISLTPDLEQAASLVLDR